jgi:hypothetical protein
MQKIHLHAALGVGLGVGLAAKVSADGLAELSFSTNPSALASSWRDTPADSKLAI